MTGCKTGYAAALQQTIQTIENTVMNYPKVHLTFKDIPSRVASSVIGRNRTDYFKVGSRNVAEARVATVFYFLQNGQDKSTSKFLMR